MRIMTTLGRSSGVSDSVGAGDSAGDWPGSRTASRWAAGRAGRRYGGGSSLPSVAELVPRRPSPANAKTANTASRMATRRDRDTRRGYRRAGRRHGGGIVAPVGRRAGPRRPSPANAKTANTASRMATRRDRDTRRGYRRAEVPESSAGQTAGRDLVRAAPGQRHAGAAVAVAVHHVAHPFQPHLGPRRAAARPCGRAPRRPRAPAPAAAPGAGSRRPPPGTASGSTPPRRRCRRPRRRASAGRRTSGRRAALPSSHQRSRPTCSTYTTWPWTGCTVGSAARNLAPIPEQFTTASGPPSPVRGSPCRLSRVTEPPAASTRSSSQARWTGISTTGAVNVQPPSKPAGTATVSRRSGTASAHHGRSSRRGTTSVPSCIRTPLAGSPASRANSSYVARAQREHPLLGEGAVGVPDRGGHGRRGLARQVPGQHVDPVAGLEQPDRAGQADDARADDQDPAHGTKVRRRLPRRAARSGRHPRRRPRGRRTPRCPRRRPGCGSPRPAGRSWSRPPRPAP